MKCPGPSVSSSMSVPSPGMISLSSLRMAAHSSRVSLFPCPHQVWGKILNGSTKGVEMSPVAPGWLNLDLMFPCSSTMWRGWDRLAAWKIQETIGKIDGVVKSGRYLQAPMMHYVDSSAFLSTVHLHFLLWSANDPKRLVGSVHGWGGEVHHGISLPKALSMIELGPDSLSNESSISFHCIMPSFYRSLSPAPPSHSPNTSTGLFIK